jgi:hypothetical protein
MVTFLPAPTIDLAGSNALEVTVGLIQETRPHQDNVVAAELLLVLAVGTATTEAMSAVRTITALDARSHGVGLAEMPPRSQPEPTMAMIAVIMALDNLTTYIPIE